MEPKTRSQPFQTKCTSLRIYVERVKPECLPFHIHFRLSETTRCLSHSVLIRRWTALRTYHADELRYQRATAVRTFVQERTVDFPPGSKATELFTRLDTQLSALIVAMAEQKPARIDKQPLLKKLEASCRKIARTARAIGLDTDDTSFAKPYQMPDKNGETLLLTHVDILRSQLQDQPGDSAQTQQAKLALRLRFNAYELPADFIDTLIQQADIIRNANRTNQGENQEGVETTMRIAQISDDISDTIRQLDAIMVNKYAAEAEKLHAWKNASRIERLRKKTKAAAASS